MIFIFLLRLFAFDNTFYNLRDQVKYCLFENFNLCLEICSLGILLLNISTKTFKNKHSSVQEILKDFQLNLIMVTSS